MVGLSLCFQGLSAPPTSGRDALPTSATGSNGDAMATPPWMSWVEPSFRRIGAAEDLNLGPATAFTEDAAGYVWIGTMGGLVRFDGNDSTRVLPDHALPDRFVRQLAADGRGRIWIGTQSGGVAVLSPAEKTVKVLPMEGEGGLPHRTIYALAIAPDGFVWVGTRGGLARIDPESLTATSIDLPSSAQGPGGGREVFALGVAPDGAVWVGSSGGAFRFKDGRVDEVRDPSGQRLTVADSVWSFGFDSQGGVWVGTASRGAYRVAESEGGLVIADRFALSEDGQTASAVRSIVEVRPGVLWMACFSGGIAEVDAESGSVRWFHHTPGNPASLPSDTLRALMRTRDGLIWAAADNGVALHNPLHVAVGTVHRFPDTPTASIKALALLPDGRLAAGLGQGGLRLLTMDQGPGPNVIGGNGSGRGPRGPEVTALAATGDGRLWIGTAVGLEVLEPSGTSRSVPLGALRNPYVKALAATEDAVWVGAYDGLLRLDLRTGGLQVHRTVHGDARTLSDDRVGAIQPLPDGRLWVGTEAGLNLFDPATGRAVRFNHDPADPESLSHNFINALTLDSAGRLWIGTFGGGISVLPDATSAGQVERRFRRIQTGVLNDNVTGILEDEHGRIWAAAANGLALIDPRTMSVRTLTRGDGVWAHSYVNNSTVRFPNGDLAIGGPEGLTLVRPALLPPRPLVRAPLVTRLTLGGRELDGLVQDPDRIATGERSLTVEFSSMDFLAPQDARYLFRLDGFDTDWQRTEASRRTASYTNLGPGTYRFRVRTEDTAVAAGSGMTPPETGFTLVVEPQWHETLWFKGGLLALLASFGFALVQIRTALLRKRQAFLEQEVAARTAELRHANARLEALATTDSLTGLLNRRSFRALAEQEMERARRYDHPISLLLIDLDHFKQINDRFGHAAGDVALTEAAVRVVSALRSTDRLARYGGEEFAVMLPETTAEQAAHVADRVRHTIAADDIRHGEQSIRITASIGVAEWMPGESLDALMARADEGLYSAKHGGRDRTVLHSMAAVGGR